MERRAGPHRLLVYRLAPPGARQRRRRGRKAQVLLRRAAAAYRGADEAGREPLALARAAAAGGRLRHALRLEGRACAVPRVGRGRPAAVGRRVGRRRRRADAHAARVARALPAGARRRADKEAAARRAHVGGDRAGLAVSSRGASRRRGLLRGTVALRTARRRGRADEHTITRKHAQVQVHNVCMCIRTQTRTHTHTHTHTS
mmetsp:Transcript_69834/g.209800  ORF Transcript_69834/g.209800 Transcript_69834/m.209800 type:complete len:202 (+) Transcript_69834:838-1443(+)